MLYEELVSHIARRSGINHERVRTVLETLPDALLLLSAGEVVRTPLGVFRMVEHVPREVLLPDREKTAQVIPKLVVKLRPGVHLRKLL